MPYKKITCPVCEVNRIDPRSISCRKCFVDTGRSAEVQRDASHGANSGSFKKGRIPHNKGLYGEDNPQWTNGETTDNRGYIFVWNPEEKKYYQKHRLIMESYLNCTLESYLIVHHRDENPSNNSLDNLEVMTYKEHNNYHKGWEKRKWRPTIKR